jgi:16S rRNA G1207 methylase RsmC
MANLSGVVKQLSKERKRLEDELHRVTAALTAFGRVYMYGSKPKAVATRKKRTISAAGRRKIAAAQRARWAKVKAGKKKAA